MSESSELGPVCWQTHKELGFKYNKIFSDYQKLLAKYNGLFEWIASHDLEHIAHAGEAKKEYEESLK